MKKIIVLLMFWLAVAAGSVSAADNHAGQSATLIGSTAVVESADPKMDAMALAAKRRAIQSVLAQYDSPMTESVDAFLHACVKYNIDCYLLPAIAGLESSFGKHIWPDSYNAFGWGGGYIMFDSWETGIDTVARGLAENYIGQGRIDVESIGPKYSESATWAVRVRSFMTRFEATEGTHALHSAVYSL